MSDAELNALARRVGTALQARGLMLATAESCTGGGIACALTDIAGSSAWFERGFVTYSNEAKQEQLGVSAATLAQHGAVSEPVALEMASGALRHSRAQAALSVTGIAGPAGGTAQKPVGMVCFAWALPGQAPIAVTHHFKGDRAGVRRGAVAFALQGLLDRLEAS
ncbi:MAG TPA: nicotinamide-nucleotide amidase [Burkholderiales bacterium]|nr:nicotinamide-nucleotide amidase [Burkholderiales bacterium]